MEALSRELSLERRQHQGLAVGIGDKIILSRSTIPTVTRWEMKCFAGSSITLSLGRAPVRGNETMEELLVAADSALYRAKDGDGTMWMCGRERSADGKASWIRFA